MSSKFIAAILICALTLSAQDKNFFPKPGYFREAFSNHTTRVEMMPPVRLAERAGAIAVRLRQRE